MKKLALLFAFALLVLPVVAAEDFSGKWSGSFSGVGPDGQPHTEQMFLVLTQKGAALTGTAGPNENQQWKIENGKADGNNVAFEVQGGGDAGGPRLKFALAFADGHLKGDVKAEKDGMALTAKADVTRVK